MLIHTKHKEKIKFSKIFWVANTTELFERAAYLSVFIAITLYLTRILGFNDIKSSTIAGTFAASFYLLPPFAGTLADKIGFRNSLLIAFTLLTIGYGGLAVFPTCLESAGLVEYSPTTIFKGLTESPLQYVIIPIMIPIIIGGAFVKSVISGTIAKETTQATRAKGFAIFYSIINIGAFSGKAIVKPLRETLGNEGLIMLNYFSAGMTFLAFLTIWLFYKNSCCNNKGKSFRQTWQALLKVCTNGQLIILILIISGFWLVQTQLYATMPKYVLRLAGEGASPSWYANVNPLVVILCVNLITRLMRHQPALTSMIIGMFIMPLSTFCMASGNMIHPDATLFTMHPVAYMMVAGIILQGLAETFIPPRYLEYFSLQAPKGEEGLYLGFSHLHTFFSSILGFGLSGVLLNKYCPDENLFSTHDKWMESCKNAHYIWYYFTGIATLSAIALMIYGRIVKHSNTQKMP